MMKDTKNRRFGSLPRVSERDSRQCPTTRFERLLLVSTILLFPLSQRFIPTVAGFSSLWIMFAVLAGYLVLNRPVAAAKTALHPVFLTAFVLLVVSVALEFTHPHTSYSYLFRVSQMVVGAIFVASLCRDRKALLASLNAYLITGAYLGVLLCWTTYSAASEATGSTFHEASRVRAEVLANQPLNVHVNTMGFIVAQGALVGLALGLKVNSSRRRKLFLGLTLFLMICAFLPFSRSAVVVAILGGVIVLYRSRISFGKTIVVATLIGGTLAMWVPDVIWSRMTFSTEVNEDGRQEGRARILTATLKHLPEYALTGVGAGNFYGPWGERSKFAKGNKILGAHNVFFQVTIFWGVAGLLALIAVVWQVYRYVPRQIGGDALALCVVAIAVSLLLLSLAMHNLYAKEFSLGLGLIVGSSQWIWRKDMFKQVLPQPRSYQTFSRHQL